MNGLINQHRVRQVRGALSPEAAGSIRATFFSLFGSPSKLDLWLTTIADDLADPQNPRTRPIPLANIPMAFQSWMHRPREVVDMILDRMHDLAIWSYTVKIIGKGQGFQAVVVDQASGHLLEEVEGHEGELPRSLAEKYGPNVEIIQE